MDTAAQTALHIVILEDSVIDAELMEMELRKGGVLARYTRVETAAEFNRVMDSDTVDLILADYTLPDFNGLTALGMLRARLPGVPFIFVSGSLGEERAIEALKSGATDYVLKERLQRLPAVVTRALTEASERRERLHAEHALEEQRVLMRAIIDNLPEHIYAVDANSRLTVINQAMLSRLECRREDAVSRKLSDILSDERAREMELQDAMVLNSGRPLIEHEHVVEQEDGSVMWSIASRIPLRDPHSNVVGVVCTERDITSRKELEQEILDISNREQRSMGNDLHDGLGQELTGLSLMMKGLQVQMEREGSAYLPQVVKMSELITNTIQSTRLMARGLAPVNLERGGLREALRLLTLRCSAMYNMQCTLEDQHANLPELDEGQATHLYRIAQEATTNAARHARATSVVIELRTTARRLQLSITDNGIGLRNSLGKGQPGMGLKIMEYRARTIGGSISFETLPKGTRIALSCSLQLLRKPRGAANHKTRVAAHH
ncbi:MAG TPA: PAS domain S-box protein [Steroidobacteraceae bacterium]|nr:PAS domain S-box protein [Steroidobacteraceae bacterium]